jgi:hypothetical protein
MYPDDLPLRSNLRDAHSASWRTLAGPGAFFSGSQRIDIVRQARAALACPLCHARADALSPNDVNGEHTVDENSDLAQPVIDAVHRIRTDPARLTRAWFTSLSDTLSEPEYVEMVSVINTSVIIDTLHTALGLDLPELPTPEPGEPSGVYNNDAVFDGAWLPIMAAPKDLSDTGLPAVPNIVRSMGLVPSAVDLFFTTFRPHYALKDIPLSISQAQAEFVASRVSAMNECFY